MYSPLCGARTTPAYSSVSLCASTQARRRPARLRCACCRLCRPQLAASCSLFWLGLSCLSSLLVNLVAQIKVLRGKLACQQTHWACMHGPCMCCVALPLSAIKTRAIYSCISQAHARARLIEGKCAG